MICEQLNCSREKNILSTSCQTCSFLSLSTIIVLEQGGFTEMMSSYIKVVLVAGMFVQRYGAQGEREERYILQETGKACIYVCGDP